MQISEVAKKYGLTVDTLRYYEKEGLIGPIKKEKNGIRNYNKDDLKRIEFVKCMRSAGVEVSFLKRYMKLYEEGDHTLEERKDILIKQREILKQKIDRMRRSLPKIKLQN